MYIRLVTVVFCTVAHFSGPRVAVVQAQEAGEITTEKQSFQTKTGEIIEYEIGTLFVAENRNDPKSRVIGVGLNWPSM